MAMQFKPIKPKRVSDQVFEQIREMIFRGELQPGQQLMPERELAAAMEVSRTTIRDAINKLVAIGLLEQKQGQGTFVRTPDSREGGLLAEAMKTQNATLEDLLEVRMGLECNTAALAAQRWTERDLIFMQNSLNEMRAEIGSGRLGSQDDVSFHMAISYASQNPVQVYLMKRFYDFLFVGIKENLQALYEVPGNIELILEQHTRIFEAIKSRDPERAYRTMKQHITFVMDFFKNRKSSFE